jgi:hypothetical protein
VPLATRRAIAVATPCVLHPPGTAQLVLALPRGVAPGRYTVDVLFTAEADATRTTLVRGAPFTVW